MRRTKNTFFVLFLFVFALAPASAFAALVNLNTASLAELKTLSGVGDAIAQSIVDNRPYTNIEQVSRAAGIGEPGSSSYEKVKNYITVGESQAETQTQTQATTSSQTSQTTQTQQTASGGGNPPPAIVVEIDVPARVVAGGGSYFETEAYGTRNEPLSSATFKWNFGDGATAEGRRVFHTYSYPGSYVVVLTAVNNLSTANARVVVEAAAAQAAFVVENDGSATLLNKSNHELGVGLWAVVCGTGRFVVPEGTTVLSGGGVRFSPMVMKFSCGTDAQLLYPNGTSVAEATPAANSPLRGEQLSAAQVRALSGAPAGKQASQTAPASQGDALKSEPSKAPPVVHAPLAASLGESDAIIPSWVLYSLGLVALLVLGVSAAWYARAGQQAAETTPAAEEFEIYEEHE